jgi:hypothetical protein
MVGPALRQLLYDLEHTSDRSDYEEALIGEIRPLVSFAQRFQPIDQAIKISLAAGGGEQHSMVSLQRTLVSKIAATFRHQAAKSAVQVGGALSALGRRDAVRNCSKSDCPYKRL